MSESMNNKYHKYRSKSGRALPGWVKMAAVTLGVGVGSGIGMMPGVRARQYHISLSSENPMVLRITDVDAGKSAKFLFRNSAVDSVEGAEGNFGKYYVNEDVFSCGLGSFALWFAFKSGYFPANTLAIRYGSCDDSLSIDSTENIRFPMGDKVSAKHIIISEAPSVCIQGTLKSSFAVFLRCEKVVVESWGRLTVHSGIFLADSKMINDGVVQYGTLLSNGECSISGKGKSRVVFNGMKGGSILDGLDESLDEMGSVSQDQECCWYPFGFDVDIPFKQDTEGVIVRNTDNGRCFFKMPYKGEFDCVFVGSVGDGCGAQHKKLVCFCVESKSGKPFGQCIQRLVGGKLGTVVCSLRLKIDENSDDCIAFKLLNDKGCKCARSRINMRSLVYVFPLVDGK